jgi:hypothetical protein
MGRTGLAVLDASCPQVVVPPATTGAEHVVTAPGNYRWLE